MDIQRSRRSKKSFIRKSKVSIIPVKESPAKFCFSQIRESMAPSSKTVDFLSLFLNPQAEEQKRTEIPKDKHNEESANKVSVTEEDKLKDLLTKGKSISSKEKHKEQQQRKRHDNTIDPIRSKRKIKDSDSLAMESSIVVSLKPVITKTHKMEFIDILNSLLAPPIIEVNIRVEEVKEDEKVYIVTLSSKQISKLHVHRIGIKFKLTLFYDNKKKEVLEVEYQYISIDPPRYKLHESMKVYIANYSLESPTQSLFRSTGCTSVSSEFT